MFFVAKKEEVGAVSQFRKNCTYHGLDVHLSLKALQALKSVVDAEIKGEEPVLNSRDEHTLGRRGLIRITNNGGVVLTQLGLLVIGLAEAGDLITIKKEKVKV